MGANSSISKKAKSPSNIKILEKYIGKTLAETNAKTVPVAYLLSQYNNQSSRKTLDSAEFQIFLMDFLKVRNYTKVLKDTFNGVVKSSGGTLNFDNYCEEFLVFLLNDIDPKVTNVFDENTLKYVISKDWDSVLKEATHQSAVDRQFLWRLRETTAKKNASKDPTDESLSTRTPDKQAAKSKVSKSEVSVSPSGAPSSSSKSHQAKGKGIMPEPLVSDSKERELCRESSSNSEEADSLEMENKEMDAIWEQHLNEEEMEKKLELAITGSKALTSSGIHNLRSKMINKVSEILQIKTHVAQAILNKANWDHEKVLFEYFNDPEAYLKGLNLDENTIRDPENGDNGTGDKKEEEEKTITCSICFDDFPLSKTTKLDTCGHLFCNDCWGDNLNFQISTGHTIDINCMSQNCNELVPPHVVQKLVSPEMCSKYNTFLGKTFVENSKTIIWCTAPGCDLALSDPVTEGKIRVLTCECGLRICWACRKEAHPPLTCEEVANFMSEAEKNPELKYLVDNDLDAETLKWMHENTKECPFCNVTIQKNDGCFCMTCSSCHKQWCWLCKESWSTHSGHFRCSKYGVGENGLKNTAEHNDKDLLKKRLELEKLLTVFKAYKSNSDGGGVLIDENDKKRMESILKEWESFDISFIPEAKKTIKKCKESLKYTQMFLFVHKGKNRAIGEYLYEILQTAVGRLSQSLDKDPLLIKAPEVRKCTNLCLLALENLLAFVTEDTELTVNTKKKKPKTEKIKST